MKVCTQCNIEKDGCEFPKRKINKDGLYSWCKECCKAKTNAYRLENSEAVKLSREKRKDKANAVAREYKKKHKTRLDAQKKVHYILNREKIIEKAREYGRNLSQEKKEKKSEYYHKWKTTDQAKKYLKSTYPERRKKYAKHKIASRTITNAIRDGKLIRAEKCTLCLSTENIEGHHPDYNKPLEVVWLCRKCHRNHHKELKSRRPK